MQQKIIETVKPVLATAIEKTTPLLTTAIEKTIGVVEKIDPDSSNRDSYFRQDAAEQAAVASNGVDSTQPVEEQK